MNKCHAATDTFPPIHSSTAQDAQRSPLPCPMERNVHKESHFLNQRKLEGQSERRVSFLHLIGDRHTKPHSSRVWKRTAVVLSHFPCKLLHLFFCAPPQGSPPEIGWNWALMADPVISESSCNCWWVASRRSLPWVWKRKVSPRTMQKGLPMATSVLLETEQTSAPTVTTLISLQQLLCLLTKCHRGRQSIQTAFECRVVIQPCQGCVLSNAQAATGRQEEQCWHLGADMQWWLTWPVWV